MVEIAKNCANTPGITKVALSTNGYNLKEKASDFFNAGIRSLNISIDSLNEKKFKAITGQDRLKDVFDGIEEAFRVGFDWIKINVVLMNGLNDIEITDFLSWVRNKSISVRFIELMPTGINKDLFNKHHIRGDVFKQMLIDKGWVKKIRESTDGPAEEFENKNFQGRIGFITPYADNFCGSCNRLRVTSNGSLQLCLFGNEKFSFRNLLQNEIQKEELKQMFCKVLLNKEATHYLKEQNHGDMQTFSSCGG